MIAYKYQYLLHVYLLHARILHGDYNIPVIDSYLLTTFVINRW